MGALMNCVAGLRLRYHTAPILFHSMPRGVLLSDETNGTMRNLLD